MSNKKQTIAVGISGGVDSSVAAYLLKKQGHNVIGIFVKTWSPEWLPCTWVDEKRDAMRVCAALDIPFYFLDAEEQYKTGVAEYMISEYRAGRTPNPDVLCNRNIKFGAMWQYAQSLGASALATGHYAQNKDGQLIKGADQTKDQSYFLWMLTREELEHIYFPIGHLPKNEVRAIAKRAGLFTAVKKDSQGICFLGDVDMREFLSHYIEQKRGEVVNQNGVVLGSHDGVWFYTLGERHGFHISATRPDQAPYYVVDKDIEQNRLIVAERPGVFTVKEHSTPIIITLREANWISPAVPEAWYQAQIRYHGSLLPVRVIDRETVAISDHDMMALGQSIVLYDGEQMIGGGIIDKKL